MARRSLPQILSHPEKNSGGKRGSLFEEWLRKKSFVRLTPGPHARTHPHGTDSEKRERLVKPEVN